VKEFGFVPYGTESIVVENAALSCRPCSHIGLASCPQGHFKCMIDITAEEVGTAARRIHQFVQN
jgi:heptosyltransferase-2